MGCDGSLVGFMEPEVAQQIIPLSSSLRVTETGRNEMVFSKEELERDDIKMNENEGRKKEDPS